MVKNINSPIEWAYNSWINNFPESFNPSDMNRLYSLIKTILRYGRKISYFDWFKSNIENSKLLPSDRYKYIDLYTTVEAICKAKPVDYRQIVNK